LNKDRATDWVNKRHLTGVCVVQDMLARKVTSAAAGAVQRATAATAAQPQLQPQLHQPLHQPIVSKTHVQMQMPLLRQLESREVRIPVPWGHIAGKFRLFLTLKLNKISLLKLSR